MTIWFIIHVTIVNGVYKRRNITGGRPTLCDVSRYCSWGLVQFIHLSIYLFIYLSICINIYIYMYIHIHMYVYIYICRFQVRRFGTAGKWPAQRGCCPVSRTFPRPTGEILHQVHVLLARHSCLETTLHTRITIVRTTIIAIVRIQALRIRPTMFMQYR